MGEFSETKSIRRKLIIPLIAPRYFLKDYTAAFNGKLLRPRGLLNNGNMCFMNAILQPLVHCPPLYNLLKKLAQIYVQNLKHKTPLMEAMMFFLNEFEEITPAQDREKRIDDRPFAPEYIYDTLRTLKKIDSIKGRQEDAEEFLGFLLDGLHEELLIVQHGKAAKEVEAEEEPTETDSWMEVGPKKKTVVTRRTEVKESAISKIFGGRMRSIVKAQGSKDSVTLEPFQSLQLDISPDHVHTIDDALRNMTTPEVLDGFISPHLGVKVDATKQNFLDHIPPVLILHLKRFVYNSIGGIQKVRKHVSYSVVQKIKPEYISPASRSQHQHLEYRLFAVVYHHGRFATGGHYTCDVLRQNEEWMHIDDDVIEMIPESEVIKDHEDREPYMLFFARN
ncbi:hypothetical protein HDV05_003571 [Chytridiales sp. JEL 0842]|nr:hypothetical protein HDV05_003571 [Chytridiales sp. JEL 0842]